MIILEIVILITAGTFIALALVGAGGREANEPAAATHLRALANILEQPAPAAASKPASKPARSGGGVGV